jgi:hypothetical protein
MSSLVILALLGRSFGWQTKRTLQALITIQPGGTVLVGFVWKENAM